MIIDEIFGNYKLYLFLPEPLLVQIKNLRLNQEVLLAIIKAHEQKNMYDILLSKNAVVIVKLESRV